VENLSKFFWRLVASFWLIIIEYKLVSSANIKTFTDEFKTLGRSLMKIMNNKGSAKCKPCGTPEETRITFEN